MRWRKILIAGPAALVMTAAGGARADCPTFSTPQETRDGGQVASTVMGGMKQVPPPSRHRPVPSGPLSSVRIVLERSGCFGSCPSYRVEVRGDGTGSFHGDGYVLVRGDHSFRVSTETVQCLVERFRAADFWSLAPRYVASITDSPSYTVTLEIGGRRKTVEDYVGGMVGMPAAVSELEDAIDVALADRFVTGDDQTMDALRAENFDFRSEAGGALLAGAAASGPEELTLALIAAGAPVQGRAQEEGWGGGGPAIVAAARRGHTKVVRALIAAGAFTGEGAKLKDDALLAAVSALHDDVVVEILAAGPDINARANDGGTVLIALQPNYVEPGESALNGPRQFAIAQRLLAAGADATLRDRSGAGALHGLSEPRLVPLLLKAGAPLEARDEFGNTPLLSAESDDAALALLEAGADLRAVDDSGDTVFSNATEGKWTKTLAFLSGHGVTQ